MKINVFGGVSFKSCLFGYWPVQWKKENSLYEKLLVHSLSMFSFVESISGLELDLSL